MRAYFSTSQLSEQEKQDILGKHKQLYNGYQTLQAEIPNSQPLYTQDFAKDKGGIVMNNKGTISTYKNFGINEEVEGKEVCEQCKSGTMEEGICNECGYGRMEEDYEEIESGDEVTSFDSDGNFLGMSKSSGDMETGDEIQSFDSDGNFLGMMKPNGELDEDKGICSECGGMMREGECTECGYGRMEEGRGKLDDIYDEEDLNMSADFDYVEGGGNDYGTFEDMHRDLYEQGGNTNDMNVSDVKPAYNFDSNGPMDGGDVYPVNEDGECEECWEKMESAYSDLKEYDDISGVQGIYSEMEPAFDFDSEGPGSAGPYQRRFDGYSVSDGDEEGELNIDFDEFDPRDKSWEEITTYTGEDEFSNVDEDYREPLIAQKDRIVEMMTRMKILK